MNKGLFTECTVTTGKQRKWSLTIDFPDKNGYTVIWYFTKHRGNYAGLPRLSCIILKKGVCE